MKNIAIRLAILSIILNSSTIDIIAQDYEEWNGDKKLEILYDSTYSLLLKTKLIMYGVNYGLGGGKNPRHIKVYQQVIRKSTSEILFQSRSRTKVRGCVPKAKKFNKIELNKDNSGFTLTSKSKYFNKYKTKIYNNMGNLISIEKI